MQTHHLTTPLTKDDIRKLKTGDVAYISGTVYAARDAAHKRMIEALDAGAPLPADLTGQLIYYVDFVYSFFAVQSCAFPCVLCGKKPAYGWRI